MNVSVRGRPGPRSRGGRKTGFAKELLGRERQKTPGTLAPSFVLYSSSKRDFESSRSVGFFYQKIIILSFYKVDYIRKRREIWKRRGEWFFWLILIIPIIFNYFEGLVVGVLNFLRVQI